MAREDDALLASGGEGRLKKAPWTAAQPLEKNSRIFLPQAIAHRGYNASWPENTMQAFKAAAEVGVHAIETDIHLSSDGVAMLCHDPTLKRCYGVEGRVNEYTVEYLTTLRTLREPRQAMPTFVEFLKWLSEPKNERLWVLLDIKIDDDAVDVMQAISRSLEEVKGPMPWEDRIVLGCWNARFLEQAHAHLPEYPKALISWFLPYAWTFFCIPNLAFNLEHKWLASPLGKIFLRMAQRDDRPMFAWTVNGERWMEYWARRNLSNRKRKILPVKQQNGSAKEGSAKTSLKDGQAGAMSYEKLIDGVITDDPKLYLEVCRRVEKELSEEDQATGTKNNKVKDEGPGVVADMWDIMSRLFLTLIYFVYLRYWIGRLDSLSSRSPLVRKRHV